MQLILPVIYDTTMSPTEVRDGLTPRSSIHIDIKNRRNKKQILEMIDISQTLRMIKYIPVLSDDNFTNKLRNNPH